MPSGHEFCLLVANVSAVELRQRFDGDVFLEHAQVWGLVFAMAASLSAALLLRMRWRLYSAPAVAASLLAWAGLLHERHIEEDTGVVGGARVLSSPAVAVRDVGNMKREQRRRDRRLRRQHRRGSASGGGASVSSDGSMRSGSRGGIGIGMGSSGGGEGAFTSVAGGVGLPPIEDIQEVGATTPGRRATRAVARGGDGGCCNNSRRVWWFSRLVLAVVVSPITVLVAWGVVVSDAVCPSLVGLSVATLGPGTCFLVYGFALWYSRRWRFTASNGELSAVAWSFALSFVCVILFTLFAIVTYRSYAATSWLFLGLDMLPMVSISYWLGSWHHPRTAVISASLGTTPWDSIDRCDLLVVCGGEAPVWM